ncbi:MAG: ATP-binding cassette domain-containing protein [Spirochaetota bacterium]|nr:ATP-binding cassette domain-containing protein [Spirochaetota bacterium]
MIELRNICKTFNDVVVLNGINAKIEQGETFVIIGQSGTGKTVTLRHIAGLVDPDSGDVFVDGIRMNGASRRVKDGLRRRMGIVFQSGALINWMTVRDNIALPLREQQLLSLEEIDREVDEKLEVLQLSEAQYKMPAEISGGMRKRASLARVLVINPDIILYDEPTSGLDPVMSSLINELIRQMQQEYGLTSVVVTHDMNSAYYIADRIAMLYKGEIIQCDTPDGIKNTNNHIVEQFIYGNLEGPIDLHRI